MTQKSSVLLVGAEGYIGSNCTLQDAQNIDLKTGQDFLTYPIVSKIKTIIFLAAAAPDVDQTIADYLYNESLYDRLDRWLSVRPNIHVIFASSAAVYGETTRPSRENDYLAPLNLYGRSKLAGEFRVREYKYHTVLRFGNVYGTLTGQKGRGVTEIFAAGGNKIYGNGEQVRDFVPISMIWNAIEAAVNNRDKWQGVINVSTGISTTINDWFKEWGSGKAEYSPERQFDIQFSTLDNKKMLERLS